MTFLHTLALGLTLGAAAGIVHIAGQSPHSPQTLSPRVEVKTWRIRPVGKAPNDYWVDGTVRNTSGQVLTGVQLRFNIVTARGVVLGESDAPIKLVTLLPGQACLFAAPVGVHDKRMARIVLVGVKVATAGDVLIFKDVPFAAMKKSDLFRGRMHSPLSP